MPMSQVDVLLLNGPNLGVLGTREPDIYGETTLGEIEESIRQILTPRGFGLRSFQSDHEGTLVETIHAHTDCVGAIVNPGALMVAGWSLRDALASWTTPWIEVHISNLWARESFRHSSVLFDLASGIIVGLGSAGYTLATHALLELLTDGA